MAYYVGPVQLGARVTIRKERLLPMRGDVLVTIDDRVDAADVVARAAGTGKLRLIDAAHHLGVKPQELKRYTLKRIGEAAGAGDVLASKPRVAGILPRSIKAPVEGRIVASLGGRLLFEETPTPIELRADVSGRIVSVMPNRGVVIETVGTIIQASCGTRGKASGVLRLVAASPDAVVGADLLDVACLGSILICGSGITAEALKEADRLKAKGIIVGSLPIALLALARSLSFPVVITEGIGNIAMSQMVYDLLSSAQGKEASLEAGNIDPWQRIRPEILIPEPMARAAEKEPPVDDLLVPKAILRTTRQPGVGVMGSLDDPVPSLVRYGNGMLLPSVRLRQGKALAPITVPVVNVERVR